MNTSYRDINSIDAAYDNMTPLMYAATNGYVKNVKKLLKHIDIAVDLADEHGDTALHIAAINKHPAVVKLLLEAGANPNISNDLGSSPLNASQSNPKTIKLLLEAGTDVNHRTNYGSTALMHAAHENIESVQLLLDHGADPNIESYNNSNALLWSLLNKKHIDISRLLSGITTISPTIYYDTKLFFKHNKATLLKEFLSNEIKKLATKLNTHLKINMNKTTYNQLQPVITALMVMYNQLQTDIDVDTFNTIKNDYEMILYETNFTNDAILKSLDYVDKSAITKSPRSRISPRSR